MMRKQRGFSLAEVSVVLAILLVLVGALVPSYRSYRGRAAVNFAAEVTEGLLVRGKDEAKASGFALPATLRSSGVPTAGLSGPLGLDGTLAVKLRKRYRAGQPAEVLSRRELSTGASIALETAGLGVLDLDTQTDLEGVYLEFVMSNPGSTDTPLATIPIDVNGAMLLHGNNGQGSLRYSYNSNYARSITVTARGVITPDRR